MFGTVMVSKQSVLAPVLHLKLFRSFKQGLCAKISVVFYSCSPHKTHQENNAKLCSSDSSQNHRHIVMVVTHLCWPLCVVKFFIFRRHNIKHINIFTLGRRDQLACISIFSSSCFSSTGRFSCKYRKCKFRYTINYNWMQSKDTHTPSKLIQSNLIQKVLLRSSDATFTRIR